MITCNLKIENNTETRGDFTSEFAEALSSLGRMIKVRVFIDGSLAYENSDIKSLRLALDGSLMKSLMRSAEIQLDSMDDLSGENITDIQLGISADGSAFYYISFGSFRITETDLDFEKNSNKSTGYDSMICAMKGYSIAQASYQTNYAFLQAVAGAIGLGVGSSFPHDGIMAFPRNTETYSTQHTYRDVLDDFAEMLGGFIIAKDGRLELLNVNETGLSLDVSSLKSISTKDEYPQVTNVVLSRQPQEDNVSYTAEETSGSVIKLCDNLITEGNQTGGIADRTPYLRPLYDTFREWGAFKPFELDSYGYLLYEPGDVLSLTRNGKTSRIIWMSSEILISQGISEKAWCNAPEASVTDFKKSAGTSLREMKTYLYVDKAAGEIRSEVSDELNTKVSEFMVYRIAVPEGVTPTKDTEGWTTGTVTRPDGYRLWQMTKTVYGDDREEYSTPADITGSDGKDGTGINSIRTLYAYSLYPDRLVSDIDDAKEGQSIWFPSVSRYPSKYLYPVTWQPSGDPYLTDAGGICWYAEPRSEAMPGHYQWLREETEWSDGTTELSRPHADASSVSLLAKLADNKTAVIQNESRISQIALSVDRVGDNLSSYKQEAESERTQTAAMILDRVSRKTDAGEVVSIIEQNADSIRLKAGKIMWESDNSSMDENGTLTCANAVITGSEIRYQHGTEHASIGYDTDEGRGLSIMSSYVLYLSGALATFIHGVDRIDIETSGGQINLIGGEVVSDYPITIKEERNEREYTSVSARGFRQHWGLTLDFVLEVGHHAKVMIGTDAEFNILRRTDGIHTAKVFGSGVTVSTSLNGDVVTLTSSIYATITAIVC